MNKKIKELLSKRSADWRFKGDVNTNFKALYSIAKYDKSLLDGEALGKISAMLISLEKAPGGPYYSEFQDDNLNNKKKTIDSETNKNIAKFLSLYEIDLPALRPYYQSPIKKEGLIKKQKSNSFTPDEMKIMLGIRKCFKRKLSSLPLDIREPAKEAFERTITGNIDKQMSLAPYYLKLALGEEGRKISKKMIENLGMINIFFWSAFIIYDDFWDQDEMAEPRFLPVANMFARYHTQFFSSSIPEKSAFKEFFSNLMNHLDTANAWEIKHCRANMIGSIFNLPKNLPDYKNYLHKYEPASGHILGPVLMLYILGKEIDVKNLTQYFRHLLISMQINDDMHDLEEDLSRGHISTAVESLLRFLPLSKRKLNLGDEMLELKKIFWFNVLPNLAKKAIDHAEKSLDALSTMKLSGNTAPLRLLAENCKKSGEKALREHASSTSFIFSLSNL